MAQPEKEPDTTTARHTNLATALVAAQEEFPEIPLDSDGQIGSRKYKYASLDVCLAAIRPALNKHGISLRWELENIDESLKMRCATIIQHTTGNQHKTSLPLYCDRTMQSLGSAITYAKRYGLLALCGCTADADDDGASSTPTPSREQHGQNRRQASDERRQQRPQEQNTRPPAASPPTPADSNQSASSSPAAAPLKPLTFDDLVDFINCAKSPGELLILVNKVADGEHVTRDRVLFERFLESAGRYADAKVQGGTWTDAATVEVDRRLRKIKAGLAPKQKELIA